MQLKSIIKELVRFFHKVINIILVHIWYRTSSHKGLFLHLKSGKNKEQ